MDITIHQNLPILKKELSEKEYNELNKFLKKVENNDVSVEEIETCRNTLKNITEKHKNSTKEINKKMTDAAYIENNPLKMQLLAAEGDAMRTLLSQAYALMCFLSLKIHEINENA